MPPLPDTALAGGPCAVSHSSQVSPNAPSVGAGVIPAAANAWETRTPSTLPRFWFSEQVFQADRRRALQGADPADRQQHARHEGGAVDRVVADRERLAGSAE